MRVLIVIAPDQRTADELRPDYREIWQQKQIPRHVICPQEGLLPIAGMHYAVAEVQIYDPHNIPPTVWEQLRAIRCAQESPWRMEVRWS